MKKVRKRWVTGAEVGVEKRNKRKELKKKKKKNICCRH